MKRLTALAVAAAAFLLLGVEAVGGSAQASTRVVNGQITFGRFDPAVGDQVVYVVNPDGAGLHKVISGPSVPGECPHWSPDGSQIATCGNPNGGATRIIDASTGAFRDLPMPDPSLFTACDVWSPSGARLACESFGTSDGIGNGIYTLRTSDGGGLTRITSNPNGDDLPDDYSPSGRRLVFSRNDPTQPPQASQALFVVNTDGSALTRITPWGLRAESASWSPDGRWILFDAGGKLYVVHPDGTTLSQIHLDAAGSGYRASHPVWCPEGTMIAFSLLLRSTEALDIYTARADGTHLVQVTTALPGAADVGEGDEVPDWGPQPASAAGTHA